MVVAVVVVVARRLYREIRPAEREFVTTSILYHGSPLRAAV